MSTPKTLLTLLVLILFQSAFAQTTEPEKPTTVTAELRKEAVAFLRETSAEVGTLRSLENRISFSSEMAGLMWFHDQKEAAAMYQAAITDFKQLLADYDAQFSALGIKPDELQNGGGRFFGGDDDKSRLMQRMTKAIGVRQQIAMSLAEHDATLAFDFYSDTLSILTNAEFRKMMESRDSYFETQFLKQLIAKDASKAVELARRSLAKGVNWTHVDLLKQIYEKDAEKGAEYADAIVKKIRDDKASSENLYNVSSFLRLGAENGEKIKKEGGKKPMFTASQLRDLAEVLAQGILQTGASDESGAASFLGAHFDLIEKYAPARAVQLRAKFPDKIKPRTTNPANVAVKSTPVSTSVEDSEAEMTAEVKARKEQEETMQNVMKLSQKELPKEEREKIVAQARKIINGMSSRQEKIMALSMLASQVSVAGDRALAAEIMKDAQTLVNPQPKNYKDFMEIWFLASAYSATDAERAFPILEDAIFRLNDTLTAFIKVGEFMDVSGEMIDDGEVQVGAFGGSMVSGLTRELGIASSTIRNLAVADFGKTKSLTNKFDRTEVRILAKMLVLRAVLGDEETKAAKTEAVPDASAEF